MGSNVAAAKGQKSLQNTKMVVNASCSILWVASSARTIKGSTTSRKQQPLGQVDAMSQLHSASQSI
jgi:hypothetical protein